MWGKKLVEGKTTIIADEGLTGFESSSTGFGEAWQHCKYIVEVRPDSGETFRAETKAKIPAFGGPDVGDVVGCRYDPESHKVELVLDGDPRFDPKLQRAAAKTKRADLLQGGELDPELQALMNADEAERRGVTQAAPPVATAAAPSSRLDQLKQLGELRDQGVLSDAEFEQEKARILRET
jgi:hypothetical protein